MPPKGGTTRLNPIRLQSVEHLKVRRPNKKFENRCAAAFNSMLNCWASFGQTAQACATVEGNFRLCMDTPTPKQQKQNNINYHLGRMFPKVVGPRKNEGKHK